jgi:amidase
MEDIGLLMSVLAGPDDRDPSSLPAQPIDFLRAVSGKASVAGRRIAFSADLNGTLPIEPEIAERTERAVRTFEQVGVSVTTDCFDVSDLSQIIAGTRGFGMVGRYASLLKAHRQDMDAPLIPQVEDALKLDVQAVADAERARTRYWHRFRLFMQDYDYLVTPVIGATAWKVAESPAKVVGGRTLANVNEPFRFPYAFSILGVPVLAVPAGRADNGLPIGLQIVGKRFGDAAVLEAGAAYMSMHADWITDPM